MIGSLDHHGVERFGDPFERVARALGQGARAQIPVNEARFLGELHRDTGIGQTRRIFYGIRGERVTPGRGAEGV